MALGNTYGLMLVVVLLGYGLVAIPRMLMRWARPREELKRVYLLSNKADEWLFDAVWELQDTEDEIDSLLASANHTRAVQNHSDVQYCTDELIAAKAKTLVLPPLLQSKRTTNVRSRRGSTARPTASAATSSPTHKFAKLKKSEEPSDDLERLDIDYREVINEMATLHARLKKAQNNLDNARANFSNILSRYKSFARLVEIESQASSSILASTKKFGRTILRGIMFRSLGILSIGMSALVLWSECTMMLPFNLSPFGFLVQDGCESEAQEKSDLYIFVESVSLSFPLMYISICVYWSLMKVTLFTNFKLNGNKMSSAVALVFNAQYFIRMQFPLGYNFLLMFKYNDKCGTTAFSKLMSNMDTVPFFGTGFSLYAPLMILLFSIMTYFNVYPRLATLVGMDHEDAILIALDKCEVEDEVEEKLRSGEALLVHQCQKENDIDCIHNTEEESGIEQISFGRFV
eukprot:CAMPEP_0196828542 /NCGR_PEP_ID=MMETSP1362-20130617/94732_1 /TAXON_ID=163516 /ORGANISM="Leptocylindrus danicus, Strain CCMP1856" /LENGTH=459 /DNA_ID=CAMNT_0042209223 /DNA_START=402 /DNA_END=1781 /DNA_ORIENTATION=+